MVREARQHEQHGTEPLEAPGPGPGPGPGHAGGRARGDGPGDAAPGEDAPDDAAPGAAAAGRCGEGEPGAEPGASASVVSGGGVDRAAATKAGFHPSNETTHGMSTRELREKLAAAGIGVRPANAGDFGF